MATTSACFKAGRLEDGRGSWRYAELGQRHEDCQASQLRSCQGLAVNEDDDQSRRGTQLRDSRQHTATGTSLTGRCAR
jgi:hypothetical protein